MKNKLKVAVFFLLILFLLSWTSVESEAGTESTRIWNGFVYTGFEGIDDPCTNIDKSKYHLTIINYKGNAKELTIPTEIDGIKVTEVLSLSKAKNLEILHIPNGINVYDAPAFAPKLKKITVRKDNKKYSVKNNALLNKKGTVMISYPGGYSTIKVPDSVLKIEYGAFDGAKFKGIKFGKKIKRIDNYAFCENNFKTIETSKNIEIIGNGAFYGCSKLKKVVLNKSVKKICAGAFEECNNLKAIYIYNPNCKIDTSKNFPYRAIPAGATIYGKKGSTAEKYAKKFKLKFQEI